MGLQQTQPLAAWSSYFVTSPISLIDWNLSHFSPLIGSLMTLGRRAANRDRSFNGPTKKRFRKCRVSFVGNDNKIIEIIYNNLPNYFLWCSNNKVIFVRIRWFLLKWINPSKCLLRLVPSVPPVRLRLDHRLDQHVIYLLKKTETVTIASTHICFSTDIYCH